MEEDSAPAAKRARTEREEPSSKERSEEDCEQSGTGAGQQVWPFRIIMSYVYVWFDHVPSPPTGSKSEAAEVYATAVLQWEGIPGNANVMVV